MERLAAIKAIKSVVERSFCQETEDMLRDGGGMGRVCQSATRWTELQDFLLTIQMEQETADRKEAK